MSSNAPGSRPVYSIEATPARAAWLSAQIEALGFPAFSFTDAADALAALPDSGPVAVLVSSALLQNAEMTWLAIFAEANRGPVIVLHEDDEDPALLGRALASGAAELLPRELLAGSGARARLCYAFDRFTLARGVSSRARRRGPLESFLCETLQELCTPMTVMQELVELLREGVGGDLTARQAEYLHSIHGANEELRHTFDALRDSISLRWGRLEHAAVPCDLSGAWQVAGERVAPRLKAKSLMLVQDIAPAVRWIRADPTHLEHILTACLRRAARSSPAEGTITLSAREHPDGRARIEVIDQGTPPSQSDIALLREGNLSGVAPRSVTMVFGVTMELARDLCALAGTAIDLAPAQEHRGGVAGLELPLVER